MGDFSSERSTTWSQDNQGAAAGQGPGKRTLTELLLPAASAPVQRKIDAVAPVMPSAPRPTIHDLFGRVQRKESGAEPDTAAIHASAQRGIATSATPLPHLEQIQRSFGRHDVSGVKAHVGGDAAASAREMGAQAYATGITWCWGRKRICIRSRTRRRTSFSSAAGCSSRAASARLGGSVRAACQRGRGPSGL